MDSIIQLAHEQRWPQKALFVIPTPIGNVADITVRSWVALHKMDGLACEDTRHTRGLLQHYGIDLPLIAAHQHNESEAAQSVIDRLEQGQRMGLVTDAGTPAISDPGAKVVKAVRAAGFQVIPLPGASAVICALSGSGWEGGFRYFGFLPTKSAQRMARLAQCKHEVDAVVFYESPHRLHECLKDIAICLPDRKVFVARELTKLFEQLVWIDPANEAQWPMAKGELVIMIEGVKPEDEQLAQLPQWMETLTTLMNSLPHCRLKDVVKATCDLTGAPKNAVYQAALQLKNDET